MSGLGIAFLSMKYSIIAACVMVAIGVVVLITTSILWLVWLHHIRKNQLS
jgi:hypothetical protein